MDLISLIVPVYNEEEAVPVFYEEFNKFSLTMDYVKFELLFIIDGSKDNTYDVVKDLAKKDKRVRYVLFSRNFGKDAAMYAGFEHALGDYVTVMDVDLQDPLYLLKDMYNAVKNEGYDSAAARRTSRKGDPAIRNFFADRFYKLMSKVTKMEVPSGARDYRLMNRKMLNSVLQVQEKVRFLKGIYAWVGYKTKWIGYENVTRTKGKTQWSFWKLFKNYIVGILAFSNVPIFLTMIFGFVFLAISIILLIIALILAIIGNEVGTSLIISDVIFFVGGTQLLLVGIIGNYIGKIYTEVQNRPIYIAKETEKDIK